MFVRNSRKSHKPNDKGNEMIRACRRLRFFFATLERQPLLPCKSLSQWGSILRLNAINNNSKISCSSWCAAESSFVREMAFLWTEIRFSSDPTEFCYRLRRHETSQKCTNFSDVTVGLVWFSNQKEFSVSSHIDIPLHLDRPLVIDPEEHGFSDKTLNQMSSRTFGIGKWNSYWEKEEP